jgi:hypothetical protein
MNPFRELLNFAKRVDHEESARVAELIGKNQRARSVWGEHFNERAQELDRLRDSALSAWQSTGLSAHEVRRQVRALVDACLGILSWQGKAPFIPCVPPRTGTHPEPVAAYLRIHRTRLWAAWRLVQEFAALADAEQRRNPGAKQTRNRKNKTAELLLAMLEDDHTLMNLSRKELADRLRRDPSTITRAFQHPRYGPKLAELYRDYGATLPTSEYKNKTKH